MVFGHRRYAQAGSTETLGAVMSALFALSVRFQPFILAWSLGMSLLAKHCMSEALILLAPIGLLRRYNTACAARDTAVNAAVWAWNGTVGWVMGWPATYVKTTTPPNPPRIMDTIMRVHGDQLLRHGVFNADPHAGNFLLLPGTHKFLL